MKGAHPAAVLWDLDGTLVDTEPLWMAAERDIARRHGREWTTEDAMALVGSDLIESGRYLRERFASPMAAELIVQELVSTIAGHMSGPVEWRPGALELLRDLHDADIPVGLVTMSYRSIVEPLLPRMPENIFDVIVTGDEVRPGKPHPQPYLAAADALGVDARQCLAIEDSPTGTESAHAAGCHVLVVPNHVPVEPGPGRTVIKSLTEMDVSGLRSIAEAAISPR